jgi:hypothetical protein
MCWPPRYEVGINWAHGISSTYWATFLRTSYLSHDYGSFSNITGMDLDGIWYRQIWLCV